MDIKEFIKKYNLSEEAEADLNSILEKWGNDNFEFLKILIKDFEFRSKLTKPQKFVNWNGWLFEMPDDIEAFEKLKGE